MSTRASYLDNELLPAHSYSLTAFTSSHETLHLLLSKTAKLDHTRKTTALVLTLLGSTYLSNQSEPHSRSRQRRTRHAQTTSPPSLKHSQAVTGTAYRSINNAHDPIRAGFSTRVGKQRKHAGHVKKQYRSGRVVNNHTTKDALPNRQRDDSGRRDERNKQHPSSNH
jgi:hypothetical protein